MPTVVRLSKETDSDVETVPITLSGEGTNTHQHKSSQIGQVEIATQPAPNTSLTKIRSGHTSPKESSKRDWWISRSLSDHRKVKPPLGLMSGTLASSHGGELL